MGPILSEDGSKRYFLDLYIPSYTPTLSALVESQKPSAHASDKPSLLLVALPDKSILEAFEETQVVRAAHTQVKTLISAMATPTAALQYLRAHRFAHFSRLPDAEFPFLSASHTARLTGEHRRRGPPSHRRDTVLRIPERRRDNGQMADTDGRDIAESFYKSVFSGRRQGEPYYERTGKALLDAVKRLRRKRGIPLESWVNFIHYGT
ncbi:hypothetical protein BJV74DRAFT_953558 [Russula compacta]|nr:hypothetical protein BJV74DRAFT_953558 [Russula compacta]